MTTNRSTVPSRLLCPITKAYDPDTPLAAHMFISDRLSPARKMHLEWAWGLQPHQMVIKNVQNCIGYRTDILENSINGDFVLVPTMTTLNKMLVYFSLPCDTARVYHTRVSGIEFTKYHRITFKEYMPEAAFRYFFVPITPAGEAIRDEFLIGEDSEQVNADYEDAFEPISRDYIDPQTLKQFRVVTSHVHPFFVVPIAHRLLFPIRNRPGHWPLSTACHFFSHLSTSGADYPPAWFRRRYRGIKFKKDYDDDDKMDVETTDEEGKL
ncbi:uncharacterized protein ARMOST_07787 [Armillaria ostoyae]|uniref:Uncharacterized protein n=1 Tax=Armillaria ostoyae TaxID=47428 RepID=A0A284R6R3_ARMOS|nr:uncharacterized protein ARMOST_07787 [Armillaria ostoyae]